MASVGWQQIWMSLRLKSAIPLSSGTSVCGGVNTPKRRYWNGLHGLRIWLGVERIALFIASMTIKDRLGYGRTVFSSLYDNTPLSIQPARYHLVRQALSFVEIVTSLVTALPKPQFPSAISQEVISYPGICHSCFPQLALTTPVRLGFPYLPCNQGGRSWLK
jgi:hypothetical protein